MTTTINKLTAVASVADGDQLPLWSTETGDTRRAPVSVLKTYMQDSLDFYANTETTQVATPAATGFTVTVTETVNVWLLLAPVATYATGTIVLPTTPTDKQEIKVNSSREVTALTINGSGAGVSAGVPTTIAANGHFTIKYDGVSATWYRVA